MMTLLILLFPLLGSLLVYGIGNQLASRVALAASLIQLGITAFVYTQFKAQGADAFYIFQEWISNPKVSFHVGIDGLTLVMLALTNFLTPLIILSAFNRAIHTPKTYFALILLMQFALNGVFMAYDGLLYYIFWELALIPIYFIALGWGGANKVRITIKFFIYTMGGSLLMLFGFISLYFLSSTSSFNIQDLYNANICECNQGWLFWMFFIAFAIKIPIIPFHTWQADTYSIAPTQGTMLLSGIMLKMGTYSLIRWLLPILPAGIAAWGPLAITLSVAGIVYASIIAIMHNDLKKLFAYSSLAHVGLIAAGIFALNNEGMQGSVVQMFAHGVNIIGLFFCADIIINRTQTTSISSLGGIRNVAPRFNTFFVIIVLASVALPLTNGFIGEFLLLFGVYKYNTWLAVFAILTIILSATYMLRMLQNTMYGNTNELTQNFTDLNLSESIVLGVIAVTIIVMGIYPKPLFDLAQPTIEIILNKALAK
ncbi:MAG: NADH-quinone oxidoreductase subunit M [Bacteroidia bacterium]|nr:NADH-quinone oxidoreductase subunit M [Bacteroidia bacterium]